MKITKITPFLVDKFLLVRVYTDAGIVGNGEAGLWAHHKMVYQAVEDLSAYYVGKDPRLIEHHYQTVTRDTHFMGAVISAALSAIDMALWDILGKSVDLPVHQLLGGKVRDKIKVFANVGGNNLTEVAESARKQVDAGYLSVRTQPFFPDDLGEEIEAHLKQTAIAAFQALRLRDYGRIDTHEGPRLWLFHTPQSPGWYSQGEFA